MSVSEEMTEVFAPGTMPQSVFPTSPHALPVGTRIGEFEVHRLIGEGGFGIVYLCYDQALDRYVALKEYMPSSLATRENASLAIVVKSKHHAETFEAGLKSFINEARLLAQFDHPSLLKVYRFWQANGTAYMTMPYYEGPTLKQALAALSGPPDEALLRSWLLPMLDALEEIHRASCYHRDIAPDNILLTHTGPLLLDFGAARRVIGDMTQALTVVLKPGFAPIEQYGDAATMSQGAWTDLYALASVVYFAITGRPPMSAVDRVMDDRLEPLSHRVAGRYSHALLAAVDTALCVRPQDRPQSVAVFRAMLHATADAQTADLHLWDDDAPTVPGALSGAVVDEPRTDPTTNQPTAPSPKTEVAFAPVREVALQAERTAWVPPEPIPTFSEPSVAATAAWSAGAGLAPLSGASGASGASDVSVGSKGPTLQGMSTLLPPRPPLTERTAMPSLLQQPQPRLQPLPPLNKKSALIWPWGLTLTALALALGFAAWFFSRPEASPSALSPAVPVGTTPVPATPTPAEVPVPAAPAPEPAPDKLPDPVAPVVTPAPTPKAPPVQATSPARPAEGGQVGSVNNVPRGTPPIRLGAPPTAKGDADASIVLPRSSEPTRAPTKTDPVAPPTTPNTGAGPRSIARCADIRQRAGLEDLSAEDRQFLRTQCR